MLGLKANIWYSVTGWRSSGLVSPTRKPLPVFDSYRFSIQELDQAVFQRAIDDYPGLSGYEFERDGSKVWLIWSLEDAGRTIRLLEAPDAVYDVFGLLSRQIGIYLSPWHRFMWSGDHKLLVIHGFGLEKVTALGCMRAFPFPPE